MNRTCNLFLYPLITLIYRVQNRYEVTYDYSDSRCVMDWGMLQTGFRSTMQASSLANFCLVVLQIFISVGTLDETHDQGRAAI